MALLRSMQLFFAITSTSILTLLNEKLSLSHYDPYFPPAFTYGRGIESVEGSWVGGFFDKGSWTETMAEWGKSVVCGRARLGGISHGSHSS